MTGPQLAEEEYSPQGVSSIGEAGAIDMTGVGEFKVCYLSRSFIFLIFVKNKQLFNINMPCCMILGR